MDRSSTFTLFYQIIVLWKSKIIILYFIGILRDFLAYCGEAGSDAFLSDVN